MKTGQWKVAWAARNPNAPPPTWKVGIKESKLSLYREKGHETKLARVLLIPEAVANPAKIIKGWDRPDRDGCYVYVAKPTKNYQSQTIEIPPFPGQFFLVFVLPDGTIDDWTWRPENPSDPSMPDEIKGEVLWPKQT